MLVDVALWVGTLLSIGIASGSDERIPFLAGESAVVCAEGSNFDAVQRQVNSMLQDSIDVEIEYRDRTGRDRVHRRTMVKPYSVSAPAIGVWPRRAFSDETVLCVTVTKN